MRRAMTTDHTFEPLGERPLPADEIPFDDAAPVPALISSAADREPREAALLELSERIATLHHSMDATTRVAELREGTISRLHDEVQALRSSELHRATLPLLRDLVQLSDHLHRSPSDPDRPASRELLPIREMIGDILYRYGIETFGALSGEAFDAKLHRAVEAVDTEEAALDRTIVGTTRDGFQRDGRVVRLADVRVARLRRAMDAP